ALWWFALESFCETDRAGVLAMFNAAPPPPGPLSPSRGGGGENKHATRDSASPSPLGRERAGVRGENTHDSRSLWNSALARQHILPRLMRRFATKGTRADLLVCAQLLNAAPTDEHRKLLLTGFEEACKGRALPPLP